MNDWPAAFPVPEDADHAGMTLRDWFAGQALACIVAPTAEDAARSAYALADAMLKERDK